MDSGVGFMLLGCALVACGGEANHDGRPSIPLACDDVRFDPAVEAAVRTELGKPSGELSAAELATVISLRVQGADSLAGLECLVNLRGLDTGGGDYSDLSPLAGLEDLTVVSVTGGEVHSLAPLAGLRKLSSVYFTNGKVSDLAPLAEIRALEQVIIHGGVSDVSPLANLPILFQLSLFESSVSDVSALGTVPNLTWLDLNGADVKSIDIDAPKLEDLFVGNTQVTDLAWLRRYARLQWLDLSSTDVEDISPLGDLPELLIVYLSDTRVRDLSPLLHPLPAGRDCAQLWAMGAPLDEWVVSEVVPQLCAIGWDVITAEGQCRPECLQ